LLHKDKNYILNHQTFQEKNKKIKKSLKKFCRLSFYYYLCFMENYKRHIEQLLFSEDEVNQKLALTLLPAAGYIIDVSKEQSEILVNQFEDSLGTRRKWCHHYSQLVFGFDIRNAMPRNKKRKRLRANKRKEYYNFGFMDFELIGANFETKDALFLVTERKQMLCRYNLRVYKRKVVYTQDFIYYLFKKFPYEI